MRVTRGSWPNPLYKILNQPPRAPVCENQTYTVKPVLSEHRIKRTPSIKRTRTPTKYLKLSFSISELPRIVPHKFFYFYIKNRDLTNLFD